MSRNIVFVVVALAAAFVLGLTADWWWGLLLAAFGARIATTPNQSSIQPDTYIEELDDDLSNIQHDAVVDAAHHHDVDADIVASDVAWADDDR